MRPKSGRLNLAYCLLFFVWHRDRELRARGYRERALRRVGWVPVLRAVQLLRAASGSSHRASSYDSPSGVAMARTLRLTDKEEHSMKRFSAFVTGALLAMLVVAPVYAQQPGPANDSHHPERLKMSVTNWRSGLVV